MNASHLRTLLLISLVAAILWVYAEAESLRTDEVGATINLASLPETGRVVWNEERPGRSTIEARIRLSGAAAAIQRLRSELRSFISLTPGIELPKETGEHVVNLRDALRLSQAFSRSGVTILDVSPATVQIYVDELTTYEARVALDIPQEVRTAGVPEVQPPRVLVTLPSYFVKPPVREAAVTARVDPASLARLNPGRLERVTNVPLDLPAALALPQEMRGPPYVIVDPPVATVLVTVQDQTATYVAATVPVHIRISAVSFDDWEVEIPPEDQILRNVRVTGPSDVIEDIRNEEIPLIAYVALTPDDLVRRIESKEVVFSDLPTRVRFEVDDPVVSLRIRPRGPRSEPPVGAAGAGE